MKEDFFTIMTLDIYKKISQYKILNVPFLARSQINFLLFNNENFNGSEIVKFKEMTDYYLKHEDNPIYKKIDYLCNEEEKICICNTHEDDLRKIYDGINYKNSKYISFYK